MKKRLGYLFFIMLFVMSASVLSFAQGPEFPPPAKRTVVAEVLMTEGDFLIVRGELGEIRIVVKPDTTMSESFDFGDRIKAVIRPDDSAISIVRAGPDEPIGITAEAPASPAAPAQSTTPSGMPESAAHPAPAQSDEPPVLIEPADRIIVADILMVDGDFYVVRSEYGEVRIEVTPDTKMTETFKFGDRIKAKILPNDKAVYVKRAQPDDPLGFQAPAPSPASPSSSAQAAPPAAMPQSADTPVESSGSYPTGTRKVVAEVLMLDGDFIIVRGERGEIRIEVTDTTNPNESVQFGDKVRAILLPNDRAVSVEKARPDEPIGMTEHK
ncbi:MAG: hypothetical protein NPIRA02_29730 [Nitrospirales bacterium]|nr:MAG: hypothetical protein NPIRA02_29730 [Nitrospirales bacterium]